jgi:hypothetical protein
MGWLRGLLAGTPSIVDTASLERFKRLARTETYVKAGLGAFYLRSDVNDLDPTSCLDNGVHLSCDPVTRA